MSKKNKIPDIYQIWIDTRKKYHLSHAQIQMARELGMNPGKFGKLANHNQESWKLPLPLYIEALYIKRFNKECPDNIRSIQQIVKDKIKRKKTKEAKRRKKKV